MTNNIKFFATIPDTKRAFEIPGSREEIRVTLSLPEDQVPSALRLILLRNSIFKLKFQAIEVVENKNKAKGDPVYALGSISPRDSAIRISGSDGMTIMLSLAAKSDMLIVEMLKLREQLLQVQIQET